MKTKQKLNSIALGEAVLFLFFILFSSTTSAVPFIASITPDHGPTTGDNMVTIKGSGLADVRVVSFGGHSAAIGSKNYSEIHVTTPPATESGHVLVVVCTSYKRDCALVGYTYEEPTPDKTPASARDGFRRQGVLKVTNLEQINTALHKRIPVFLEFGAAYCGACQQMNPFLNELATEYKGKATIMSADIDQSPELAEYFGVSVREGNTVYTKSIPASFVIVDDVQGTYTYMQTNGKVTKDGSQVMIQGYDKQKCIDTC